MMQSPPPKNLTPIRPTDEDKLPEGATEVPDDADKGKDEKPDDAKETEEKSPEGAAEVKEGEPEKSAAAQGSASPSKRRPAEAPAEGAAARQCHRRIQIRRQPQGPGQ